MNSPIEIPDRNGFFDGQRLFADDLNSLDSYQRAMRQLHNVSLHQHGVGSGFAVSAQPGDREVLVGPGYAIDIKGREIVNTETRSLPIPTVRADALGKPVGYYLAVSYRDDDQLEESENRESVCQNKLCDPSGTVRFREEPDFCWVRLERVGQTFKPVDAGASKELETGMKIVLCRIEVFECKLESVSIETRRNARPETQPYLRCGHSPLKWQIQIGRIFADGGNKLRLLFLLASAQVDTQEAAFVNVPCYSVRLDGPRVLPIEETSRFVVEGLASVQNSSATGFDAQIMAIIASEAGLPNSYEEFEKNRLSDEKSLEAKLWKKLHEAWQVVWMGSE